MILNGYIIGEEALFTFLILHFIISIILMFLASSYVSKRYVSDTEEALLNDEMRLKQVSQRGFFFRLLFKTSLHKNNPLSTKLFFFLFNISIPVIGYIETIWIAYLLRNVTYEEETIDTNVLDLEEFEVSFLKVERVFGEGSMIGVLLNPFIPLSKKIRALSSLAANKSPATLHIIKQALSSKDDEVRLFANATINNLEKKLSADISNALKIYQALKEKEKRTNEEEESLYNAAKELAFYYWEMVYTEITTEALEKNFLTEVKKYAKEAIEFYENNITSLAIKRTTLEMKIINMQNEKKEESETIVTALQKEHSDIELKLKNYNDTLSRLYVLQGRVCMKEANILIKDAKREAAAMLKKAKTHSLQEEAKKLLQQTEKQVQQLYKAAEINFTNAQELKETDSEFVIPYLAEIYFIQQEFTHVKNIIKEKAESLALNPRLYPIIEQWSGSYAR